MKRKTTPRTTNKISSQCSWFRLAHGSTKEEEEEEELAAVVEVSGAKGRWEGEESDLVKIGGHIESMDFAALCHFGARPLAFGNAEGEEEDEFLDLDLEDDLERDEDDLLSFLKTEGMASSSS